MREKAIHYKQFFLLLLIFVLCIAATVSVGKKSRMENQFPMWESAGEQRVDSHAVLSVIGRETDAADTSLFQREEIRVRIENTGDTPLKGGAYYCVDYYWGAEEEWYTVYHPDQVPAYAVSYEAKTFEKSFQVPEGLFHVPGRYRLYVSGLGYCDLEF